MKLSVIVPIYNALPDLQKLLKSLIHNFDFSLGEVILVNDKSDAETSDFLIKFCDRHKCFKLINNHENSGFIKTCNRGMRNAKNDIFVLLNSDTIIPTEFCYRIIKCFKSDKNIGVASPIGAHTATYYIEPPFLYSLERMNRRLRRRHKCEYPVVPAAEGYCFCIRKEVFLQQGGLDEIYGKGYHEEVDFSYRANDNGWKNVLIDDLYVYHKRHASFGTAQRSELIKQNTKTFINRWGCFRTDTSNIIRKIRYEVLPVPLLKRIFSVDYSWDRKYKIIRVLGLQFKKNMTGA